MTNFLKLLFVVAAIVASVYSMSVFGPGLWSWIFVGAALLVLASVFVARLGPLSIVLGRVSGILSSIALVILLIAATVGGSLVCRRVTLSFPSCWPFSRFVDLAHSFGKAA